MIFITWENAANISVPGSGPNVNTKFLHLKFENAFLIKKVISVLRWALLVPPASGNYLCEGIDPSRRADHDEPPLR